MSNDDMNSNKRTRASGEVLDYLLSEFETNHNPSPEQRKEISDKTNMTEKAVRIWFQNRRAKIRKSERLGRSLHHDGSGNNSRSNSLSVDHKHYNYPANFDVNDKYCFVDCSSLSVGSWQRVKTGELPENCLRNDLINLSPFTIVKIMENIDLLVILSKKNLEINYFFGAVSNGSKILFRIFYPLTNILTCSLLDNNIDKENSELRVNLSHQPKFSVNFFNGTNQSSNQWSICEDFSEGQQVSTAHADGGTSIPHVLVGLKSSICALNDFILEKIQQHQSDYMMVNDNNNSLLHSTNNSDDELHDDLIGDAPHLENMWTDHHDIKPDVSPIAPFGSDTSPTSLSSDRNINHHKKLTDLQPNFHYNEMFSANTPDFLSSSQTPNIVQNMATTLDANLAPNASPNSRPNISPYNNVPNQESYDQSAHEQFDFPVVNGYSGSDHSNPQSPVDNPVDSFIDYNHDYP